MPSCPDAKKLISRTAESGFRFVDAELFGHLKGCERCTDELKGLKKMRSAFEAAPRYRAPYGFTGRVMRVIAAAPADVKGPAPRAGGGAFRSIAAAFALAFVLAAGVLSGTFLASNIMYEADARPAKNAGPGSTLLAYSGDALDPAPDLAAGDYLTAVEDANEK